MQQLKRSLSVAASLVALGSAPLVIAGCAAPPTSCDDVAFAPNSDWLATDISTTGTGCDTAQKVVAAGKDRPTAFTADDFTCIGRPVDAGGLPHIDYACTGPDGAALTWKLVG
jgi:hypothetical protein